MPYAPMPYVPKQRDYSRSDNRMADLMQAQGNARVQAIQRSGDNRARTIAGIGGTLTNAMGDLIKYKQEAPQRAFAARKMSEEVEKMDRADNFRATQADAATRGITGKSLADLYTSKGFQEEADKVTGRVRDEESYASTKMLNDLKIKDAGTASAREIAKAVRESKDPATAWAQAAPELRKIRPDLAHFVPDAYDSTITATIEDWGKSDQELNAEERTVTEKLERAERSAKNELELTAVWTEYWGKQLGRAPDKETWDQRRALAGDNPIALKALAAMPKEFSAENVARARSMSGEKGPAYGSVEWMRDATPAARAEALALIRQHGAAGRAPSTGPKPGKAQDPDAAIRWMDTAEKEADELYGDDKDKRAARQEVIESRFAQMTGGPAPTPKPKEESVILPDGSKWEGSAADAAELRRELANKAAAGATTPAAAASATITPSPAAASAAGPDRTTLNLPDTVLMQNVKSKRLERMSGARAMEAVKSGEWTPTKRVNTLSEIGKTTVKGKQTVGSIASNIARDLKK